MNPNVKLILTKIRNPRSKVKNVTLASGQIVQMIKPKTKS